MIRRASPLALALALGLAACGLFTGPDADDDACPQTYEFGNYGCARLVVIPGALPADAPTRTRWKISTDGPPGLEGLAFGTIVPDTIPLRLTMMAPLRTGADTAAVTVIAEVRDDSGPIVLNVPLPLVAIDSARLTVRFAQVGARPDVDTVRLDLRSP